MKENNVKDELNFEVKLKPIFGIEPKIYVLFGTFFSILLLPLFFIILKLKNPGSYLIINTNILSSYVFYNDEYIGKTPLKEYISASKGVLEIKRIGYETYRENIEVNNSLFSHKILDIKLKLINSAKILDLREKELSVMSQIKNFSENIRPIPVFSLINAELKEHPELIKKFLINSLSYINSNEMFENFLNVYKEVYSLDSSTNKKLFESLNKELNLEENGIIWFLSNFKENEVEALSNEDWVRQELSKINEKNEIKSINKKFDYILPGFIKINPGSIAVNIEYKIKNKKINIENTYLVREFLIQSTNVTKKNYQEFLKENPNWKLTNKNNLIKDELVDENYLKDFEKISQNEAVTYISYLAAKEYTNWYSRKLPKGLKARLPISIEYELFEKNRLVNLDKMNINEISKKVGFWNIMEDYNPKSSYLFKKDIYNVKFNSLISDIRTYNYESNKTIDSSTKAFFMKNWTAPNIGFKLVIIKE